MILELIRRGPLWALFAGTGLLLPTAPPAWGQCPSPSPPPACQAPAPGLSLTPAPAPASPQGGEAGPQVLRPETAAQPPTEATAQAAPEPGFSAPPAAAGFSSTVALNAGPGGYIDPAYVGNMFRLRYESAFDDNRPDRAEFLYPKCGCFRNRATAGPNFDPKAPGPPLPESRIDFQDLSAYAEVGLARNFSVFVEVPYEFLNPEQNAHVDGFSDFNAGFKYAFVQNCDRIATFQLRTYVPTGEADRGLGTHQVSLEPAFLYSQRLGDRLTLQAELRDWIPIGGTDFAGNVIRYGAGLGYDAYRSGAFRVTPVAEFVGWTVLGGKEFAFPENVIRDAAGDTIVNAKLGVRLWLGNDRSLYAGYGRALTGDVWYKDIYRVEYRMAF